MTTHVRPAAPASIRLLIAAIGDGPIFHVNCRSLLPNCVCPEIKSASFAVQQIFVSGISLC
ncbi:unnamed protein product [Gongylonema pulchrum]|uniref:Uncharacterized protein n=1 Tax=Gongylonema pulchrum TaxID=637853 RepID=A0A3P6QBY5_9BILA|nr:unnamed protein product [Gongylonema pulchrum]